MGWGGFGGGGHVVKVGEGCGLGGKLGAVWGVGWVWGLLGGGGIQAHIISFFLFLSFFLFVVVAVVVFAVVCLFVLFCFTNMLVDWVYNTKLLSY